MATTSWLENFKNLLNELDLVGLGEGIGSSIAGGNNDDGSTPLPSDGIDTGATRVLPGKELILPVAADSDEFNFSRSLSGLDRDTFDRLEDIKRQTEIETGSPREKAFRAAQLRSDIARDRFTAMPTRTAMQDVNQFRDPYYSDVSDWDLADSRNAARDTRLDAANIAAARKTAAYGDDPIEQGYAPKDAMTVKSWTQPEWSKPAEGLKGLPQVGTDAWNQTSDNMPNYDDWINQQYNELLGRDAGWEGLNYWTGNLVRGDSKDQVRANIIRGDEYQNRLQLINDYNTEFGTNPSEDWLDERVGPGGEWLMEGYSNTSEDNSTPQLKLNTTWKPTANYDGGGYVPGQFGIGPKYAEYEDIFRNPINEGFTLEEAMKLSKVATPYDFEQAFGNSYQWSKHGGGSKTGSAGTKGFNSAAGNAMQGFNKSTNFGTTAPSGQGAGAMASDIQLKENIDFINKSPAGHSIYQWNYKGEPKSRRYQGVMAQDLLKTSPNAVVKMDNGYLGVKYDEIDVDFIAV